MMWSKGPRAAAPRCKLNVVRIAIILAVALAGVILWSRPSSLPIVESKKSTKTSSKSPSSNSRSSPSPTPKSFKPVKLPLLDLDAPSAAHGWVEKAGPAALRSWHASEDVPRRKAWDAYLQKRASGEISLTQSFDSVPPHGPDPWGCRLYFNHAYKIMFVRTAKTGSTTIVESIFPPCNVRPDVDHCMQRVADSTMLPEEVINLWKHYTVFTFTRNVWTRGISQYQYLVHFVLDKPSCRHVTWDEYCEDPLAIGEICRKNAECCTKKWTHQDWHMRQQTSCFLTDDNEWAVDFIGRLEHFDDDLVELFKKINEKKSWSVPELEYTPKPPANFNPLDCKESDDTKANNDSESDYEEELITSTSGSSSKTSSSGRSIKNRDSGGSENNLGHRLRRQLFGAFDTIDGNQLPDMTYCDKRKFYTGKHESCFNAMTSFFAKDVQLLHANLTITR
jgi:Sulfotransferase family